MAYGYPYQPSYFNTNYMPPMPVQPMQGMQQLPAYAQQPVGQQSAPPMTNVAWVYVNGIQGAREHIVQPGQTAWMMDNNEPIIYVKIVDSMGSATLKAFRLMDLDTTAPEVQAQTATAVDYSKFATRAEVDEINARLEKFINEVGGMNA